MFKRLILATCVYITLACGAHAGQPTPYTRQHNFTDWTQNYPDIPQDGGQMDDEYNAIKTTLDATLNNLALIQRDDGHLANASVGPDQLTSALAVTLGVAEAWATATSYAIGDLVLYQNAVYQCAIAHTSGTFAADLAAGKWTTIIDYSSSVLASTSTSSLAIGTGTKVFTIQANKYYLPGDYVLIVSAANPTVNFMFGSVTSYSGTTLTTSITATGGSGTYADWQVRISGPRGAAGPSGSLDFSILSAETTVVDGANDQLVMFDASESGGTNNKITPNAFLALGLTQLTADATPDGAADYLFSYDNSATGMKKVLYSNVYKTINDLTADATPDAAADYMVTYDTSATAGKKVLVNDFYKSINSLVADTAPDVNNDLIATYDASATTSKKVTMANLLKGINGLTTDASPDNAADYTVTYDASAGTAKKVLLSSFAGLTAGRLLGVDVFVASGTWTKPANTASVEITVIGGGGEGGTSTQGSAGGNSSFGSFCTANGGTGGGAGGGSSGSDKVGLGGAGGGGSGTGCTIFKGGDGTSGFYKSTVAVSGSGGASSMGGGGAGGASASGANTGADGGGYGGGGGGIGTGGASGTAGGGAGGGGTAYKYITSGLGSSETVTIGAGGTGGAGDGGGGIVIVKSYAQ